MKVLDEFIYEKNMMYKYLSVDVEYYLGEKGGGIVEIEAMPYSRLKEYIDKELYRKKKGRSIHMPLFYSSEPYIVDFVHPDVQSEFDAANETISLAEESSSDGEPFVMYEDKKILINKVPRYEAFLILEIGHEENDQLDRYYAIVRSMYDATEYTLESYEIDGNLSYSRDV